MNRNGFEVAPFVMVAAGFATGALVTWLLGDVMLRRLDALSSMQLRLHQRVLARIADLVSDPAAIEVQVDGALVRLSGRVRAGELDRLLSQLIQEPGVHRVYNALDVVDDAASFGRWSANPGSGGLQV